MAGASLPRDCSFIAMLPLDRAAVRVLVEEGIDIAIVSYHQLLLSGLLETARKGELRDHLGWDGRLLLSSVMPDDMLLDPRTFEDFVEVYEGGGFCAAIAWDVPAEIDLPKEEVLRNIDLSIEKIRELRELGINVVPLVKGNRIDEIKRSVTGIKELGYSEVALHASEYVAEFERLEARAIFDLYLSLLPRYFDRVLLLGTLRPGVVKYVLSRHGHLVKNGRICFAGLSWWLDASRYKAYGGGRALRLLDYAMRTEDGGVLTHRVSTRDLAKHNIRSLTRLLRGEELEVELYDTFLEPPILAISDIHIGTPESMMEEAVDLIRRIRPKTLALLGDIFDYTGEVQLYHVAAFFSSIEEVNNVVVVRGDAEEGTKLRPYEGFLRTMDALVFGEEPWTSPLRQRFRVQRYVLWFYKYNRIMRGQVRALLPSGKSVLLIHGHQIGSYSLPRDEILRKARLKKVVHEADWILLGHFHRPLLSLENGVIVLGAWQRQTETMEKIGFQPSRSAVLIDEDERVVVLMV